MKGKTLLSLAIALSMILAAMPFLAANVKAQPTSTPTTLSVVFASNGKNTITETPGTNFTVDVNINTTNAISSYSVTIGFNSTALKLQSISPATVATEGPWMKAAGATIFSVNNVYNGTGIANGFPMNYVVDGVSDTLESGSETGSGTMFSIGFTAYATSLTPITIAILEPNTEYTYLLWSDLITPVTITKTVNGNVSIPVPPPTSPTAVITSPTNLESITVGTTVYLVGTASLPGFDTTPTPASIPINWAESYWNVSDTFSVIIPANLPANDQNFTCNAVGTVIISLTVVAPDTRVGANPAYVDNNTATITVYQVAPVTGPKIDVYTGYPQGENGQYQYLPSANPYPYGWSESYGPQMLVCVFANVTYNKAPVNYKPVEFVVLNAQGQEVASYTAFSNSSGIATVCFRIPWQANSSSPTYGFGNWSVYGTVDISQVQVNDTVKFHYGWLLTVSDIAISPNPVHRAPQANDVLTITVTIDSLAIYQTWTTFMQITVTDTASVPIGLYTATVTVPPGSKTFSGTITVPSWAYVGVGTVYVSLLNGGEYGVPYCPEGTATFSITYP